MEKRCEICGKIYDSQTQSRVIVDLCDEDSRRHGHFECCIDCADTVHDYIGKMMRGEVEPVKKYQWAVMYNVQTHDSLIKCTNCGYTFYEGGKVTSMNKPECPQCKSKMEVYIGHD